MCLSIRTKSRIPLEENIRELFKDGSNRVLFCTFTTPDRVYKKEELQRRWNSLSTNVLRKFIVAGVCVPEMHKDGSWHLHVVIKLPWTFNLHSEFWSDIKHKFYAKVDPSLRWFWNTVRKAGIPYGFGRFEALPPKKGGLAMSRYLSKYLSKSLISRGTKLNLKGMRLVRYVNCLRANKVKHLLTPTGEEIQLLGYWRVATCVYGSVIGGRLFRRFCTFASKSMKLIRVVLGPKWGYRVSQLIYSETFDGIIDNSLISTLLSLEILV
jgi:hypothetical protein